MARRQLSQPKPRTRGGGTHMNGTDDRGHGHPHSTAKIADHPIHPMLIPFPIVCFVGAFVTDIVYKQNSDPGWATASMGLLGVGLVMAALAAVAGLTDYLGDERIRRLGDALKHMLANVTAVIIELVNLVLRLNNPGFAQSTGVYLSGVVVLLLLYSGWKGGDLVYRHGIGVDHTSNPYASPLSPSSPTAAFRSSTRSSFSHGKKSPCGLRPK